jgi:signal peptidase II
VGNLIDRIFREPGPFRGYVVDFLELPNWPVFNVADMALVGSAVLAVLLSLRGVEMGETTDEQAEVPADSEALPGQAADEGRDPGPGGRDGQDEGRRTDG